MIRKLATVLIFPLVATAAFQAPDLPTKNVGVSNHDAPKTIMKMEVDHHYQHHDDEQLEPLALETSRRDVIQDVIKGSFLAATVMGSSVGQPSPAVASDIAKLVKELEQKFQDSVNSKGAPEKHLPQVTLSKAANGNPKLTMVQVTVPHVMDPDKPHWILAIWLQEESSGDVAVAKVLPATEPAPPSLTCGVPKGARLTPYLYCNLHGLWKGDTFTA